MNEKVLKTLEFDRILEKLASHATSDPGRTMCRALRPTEDLDEITRRQAKTEAAVSILLRSEAPSFGNTRDFSHTLQSLKIGTSLPMSEFLRLASFLENVARVRARGPEDPQNPLYDLFDCLYPLTQISTEIRRIILDEERVSPDASPALRQIRRQQELTDDRIHQQLNRMLNQTYHDYLQDNVITMRDDRYCLPVKSEYKSQVRGIVHDASSTGSTLFIEPAAIVELGNSLRQLQIEEKKEVDRILAALAAQCADHATAIADDQTNMTTLDFIFAKAALALEENATRPVFNREHRIVLRQARHPLIDPKKVVPIDLSIGHGAGSAFARSLPLMHVSSDPSSPAPAAAPMQKSAEDDYDMIVITGPNTGGKTVTLKTTGLLELMGLAGLHIPAGDRSELSVFRDIFADIGDEQSIEQNLSTFSAHMTTTVDILRRADKNCLCLFDELGSGTDPTEGAALAISILNFLHTRKITTLATTHYAELKVYAMRTPGIVNASCEFDVESLQPTYRLLIGVPGKSNAFAISRRLGLPNYIIETAREQMSQETQNFEDVLSALEESRVQAQKARDEADRIRADLEKREKILSDQEKQIEEKRTKILNRANQQARDILRDAKETADRAISAVRKNAGNADLDQLEAERTRLREKANRRDRKIRSELPAQQKPHGKGPKPQDIHIGDKVHIFSMGMNGVVSSLPNKDGVLSVRCGILHSDVKLNDIALIAEDGTDTSWDGQPVNRKLRSSGRTGSSLREAFSNPNAGNHGKEMDFSRSMNISPEINLIGMTTDEAILALDKYLDDARMSHLDTVRVVHGKGTGALRHAVQEYLRKQKWIKGYRSGDYGEGDAGVTIVSL